MLEIRRNKHLISYNPLYHLKLTVVGAEVAFPRCNMTLGLMLTNYMLPTAHLTRFSSQLVSFERLHSRFDDVRDFYDGDPVN